MARRAADRGPGDRRRHPLGVGPDHRHRHAGRDLRRFGLGRYLVEGYAQLNYPMMVAGSSSSRCSSCSRSSSSPSPSASSHRPACSRRPARRSRGPRSRRPPADDHVGVSRGATELNGNRSRTVQYLTPGCQRDRWYCRGSSRQPQRAISLRRTQCGCSARSPLGRRCWCCSAPARRVGQQQAGDQDRLGWLRRGARRRRGLRAGPRGRRLHGRSSRHRTRHTGRHQRGARERPDRPQAGVSRQRSRQARARNADHQSGHQQAAAPGRPGPAA